MSMTKEEAIAIINDNLAIASEHITQVNGLEAGSKRLYMALQALSILAPEPRKEPPTKEDVGDEDECWYCILDSWQLDTGQRVREFWAPNENERWLPLSALPKGDV